MLILIKIDERSSWEEWEVEGCYTLDEENGIAKNMGGKKLPVPGDPESSWTAPIKEKS